MTRLTMDLGIDLGTTNSSAAIFNGTAQEIVKNNYGWEYTPSVVWIDKSNSKIVGKQAKDMVEVEPENTASEFKLQMGTDTEFHFARSGKTMKPEELSAEILKSLKADVLKRTGENFQSAVITVPAAFKEPQKSATRKAAELAGFSQYALLQEPCAAANTYLFKDKEEGFWLVYDFGGGTFDAAIIRVQDIPDIVDHEGDNHLGGKLIDWIIVENLFIPAINKTDEYKLTDFNRSNPKWRGAIAKLKAKAEQAKIDLSIVEDVEIIEDFLCFDDRKKPVEFTYRLTRHDLRRLSEPYILSTIHICKELLARNNFQAGSINKILLVGGPTLMPCVREMLANPKIGLGIPLEFREDPLTVVARGAAIYAGSQLVSIDAGRRKETFKKGKYHIELDYEPIGVDTEPLLGGRVTPPSKEDMSKFTIQFINSTSQTRWETGKIQLNPDGSFLTNLHAEVEKQNIFIIVLCDNAGNKVKIEPESFPITGKPMVPPPPLAHSVGVALANNEMAWFFLKGTSLPAHKPDDTLKTAYELEKGATGVVFTIPVMEGESPRANRNSQIGRLEINPDQVKRTIPAGSEIEVTIDIDKSGEIRLNAYIPIVNAEYGDVFSREDYGKVDLKKTKAEFKTECDRLEQLQKQAGDVKDAKALEILYCLEQEKIVDECKRMLSAAEVDPDAAAKSDDLLLRLKLRLDAVEDSLEWPRLVSETNALLAEVKNIAQNCGSPQDVQIIVQIEMELKFVMDSRDTELLRQRKELLREFALDILDRAKILEIWIYERLVNERPTMQNQSQAGQLFTEGERCRQTGDYEALRRVNHQLKALLPTQHRDEDIISWVTK